MRGVVLKFRKRRRPDERGASASILDGGSCLSACVVPLRPADRVESRDRAMPDGTDQHLPSQPPEGDDSEQAMPKKHSSVFVTAAAHLNRATKAAPPVVAERVSRAQSDVADKRKRAQVSEEVLRLRLH